MLLIMDKCKFLTFAANDLQEDSFKQKIDTKCTCHAHGCQEKPLHGDCLPFVVRPLNFLLHPTKFYDWNRNPSLLSMKLRLQNQLHTKDAINIKYVSPALIAPVHF